MKHPDIDDQSVVEHYVAGKLTAAEVASFEEHYLNCPACIQAVEDAERLQRGLGLVAAEDLAVQQSILTVAWRALRSGPASAVQVWGALATALLVVGLLPAGVLWQRSGHLEADLDAARRELVAERQPRINTPVIALGTHRIGEPPLQQISLAAEPEWIVLTLELGEHARPRYEAELAADGGAVIWESPDLEPNYLGTLSVSLHSSLLPPGRYLLSLNSSDQQLEYPLQVVAP